MQLNIENPAKCRTWNSFQRWWHWQEGYSSTHLVALVCWPGYASSHYRISYHCWDAILEEATFWSCKAAAELWAFGKFGLAVWVGSQQKLPGVDQQELNPTDFKTETFCKCNSNHQAQSFFTKKYTYYQLLLLYFPKCRPKNDVTTISQTNPRKQWTRILLL